jgi:hypothetical protein
MLKKRKQTNIAEAMKVTPVGVGEPRHGRVHPAVGGEALHHVGGHRLGERRRRPAAHHVVEHVVLVLGGQQQVRRLNELHPRHGPLGKFVGILKTIKFICLFKKYKKI